MRCDLREQEAIQASVLAVGEMFGHIDILVNNAGLFASEKLERISVAQWDDMFATNTRAPFLAAQACFEHLRGTRGRIINIGSLGGTHPWATHAHYCTSKAALHMLSETMAKAWAPEISVNCVAPGMIVQGEVGAAYQEFCRAHADEAQRDGRGCCGGGGVLRHGAHTSSRDSYWQWMVGWDCRDLDSRAGTVGFQTEGWGW